MGFCFAFVPWHTSRDFWQFLFIFLISAGNSFLHRRRLCDCNRNVFSKRPLPWHFPELWNLAKSGAQTTQSPDKFDAPKWGWGFCRDAFWTSLCFLDRLASSLFWFFCRTICGPPHLTLLFSCFLFLKVAHSNRPRQGNSFSGLSRRRTYQDRPTPKIKMKD